MNILNTGFGNTENQNDSSSSNQILAMLINALGQNKVEESIPVDEKIYKPLQQTNIGFGTINYTALRRLE